MSECLISFNKIATLDHDRIPGVMMNPDVLRWILDHDGKIQWLLDIHDLTTNWKVRVTFPNEADTIIFKLTFG